MLSFGKRLRDLNRLAPESRIQGPHIRARYRSLRQWIGAVAQTSQGAFALALFDNARPGGGDSRLHRYNQANGVAPLTDAQKAVDGGRGCPGGPEARGHGEVRGRAEVGLLTAEGQADPGRFSDGLRSANSTPPRDEPLTLYVRSTLRIDYQPTHGTRLTSD